jgi:hypothetical protein
MPPIRPHPPFTLVEHAESFEVLDGATRHLGYFHFEDEETRQSSMRRVTRAEAKANAGMFMRALIAAARPRAVGTIGVGGEARFQDPEETR